jgi:hypothetical protein
MLNQGIPKFLVAVVANRLTDNLLVHIAPRYEGGDCLIAEVSRPQDGLMFTTWAALGVHDDHSSPAFTGAGNTKNVDIAGYCLWK